MSDLDPRADALSAENPWPGLRSFREADRAFFFGRDRETQALAALIEHHAVVVCYGQSGLGKTSLLNAGVFPALREQGLQPVAIRLDHARGAPPLSAQVLTALVRDLERAGVTAPAPAAGVSLWEYFHRRDTLFWGPRNRLVTPVVVLDQFEEAFTLGRSDADAAARVDRFVEELEALVEHRPPPGVRQALEADPDRALQYDFGREALHLVITLREDFLAQLDTWRARIPSLLVHRFRLERMTGLDALAVVERAGGALVDADVARRIVVFVAGAERRGRGGAPAQDDAALAGMAVEPALLSVVCEELNRRRLAQRRTRITAEMLTAEREAIIAEFYGRAFDGLDPRVRDWVEDELLTSTGYRDRTALDDALRLGLPAEAFRTLEDRRVLHSEPADGVVWLELTHDLLTGPAARSRAERHRRREAEAAAAEAARVAAKLRRTRALVSVFAVLLVATAVALVMALRAERRARDERARADTEAGRAERAAAAATRAAADAQAAQRLAEAEAARAEDARKAACESAEQVGSAPLARYVADLDTPIARLTEAIRVTDAVLATLCTRPDLVPRHARFLASAAEVHALAGEHAQGMAAARRALDMAEAAGGVDAGLRTAMARARWARGSGLLDAGRIAEAVRDFTSALRLLGDRPPAGDADAELWMATRLGLAQAEDARYAAAASVQHSRRIADAAAGLGARHARRAAEWRVRALLQMGDALEGRDDAESGRLLADAGTILADLRRTEDSLRLIRLAAEFHYVRAFLLIDFGRSPEAEPHLASAREAARRLTEYDPDNGDWQLGLAKVHRALALFHADRNDWPRAREAFDEALRISQALLERQPASARVRYQHAAILTGAGDLARTRARNGAAADKPAHQREAARLFEAARAAYEQGLAATPDHIGLTRGLTLALGRLAWVHAEQKDHDRARELAGAAEARFRRASQLAPGDRSVRSTQAWLASDRGDLLVAAGDAQAAHSLFEEAVGLLGALAASGVSKQDLVNLMYAEWRLGDLDSAADAGARALDHFDRAQSWADRAIRDFGRDLEILRWRATIARDRGDLLREMGRPDEAVAALEVAFGDLTDAMRSDYGSTSLRESLDRVVELAKSLAGATPAAGAGPPPPWAGRAAKIVERAGEFDEFIPPIPLGAWPLPPLLPGPWRTLGAAELAGELQALLRPRVDSRLRTRVVANIRRLDLPFLEGAALYEAQVRSGLGTPGLIAYVRVDDERHVLDGRSQVIHDLRTRPGFRTGTLDEGASYLRLFAAAIQNDDGRFVVVEQQQDLPWLPDAPRERIEEVRQLIGPMQVEPSPSGGWQGAGTMLYGRSLYQIVLRVHPDGRIEMVADRRFESDLPVAVERFDDGAVRVLHTPPPREPAPPAPGGRTPPGRR